MKRSRSINNIKNIREKIICQKNQIFYKYMSNMKNRFNKFLKKYNLKERFSKIRLRDLYYLYRILRDFVLVLVNFL